MFMIGLVIITLLIAGTFLLTLDDKWDSILVFVLGMVLLIAGGFSAVSYTFSGWSYLAAKHKANIINREYGTNYTQSEIYWASGVVDTIRELERKRVEVNGKPWTKFNKDKETIELKGLTGTVAVMAKY